MAEASNDHGTIADNLFVLLRSHMRGTGCRAYISDMKVIKDRTEVHAKIFEFCMTTVLLNGLRKENTGTKASR